MLLVCMCMVQGAQAAKKHHTWLIKKIKDKLVCQPYCILPEHL